MYHCVKKVNVWFITLKICFHNVYSHRSVIKRQHGWFCIPRYNAEVKKAQNFYFHNKFPFCQKEKQNKIKQKTLTIKLQQLFSTKTQNCLPKFIWNTMLKPYHSSLCSQSHLKKIPQKGVVFDSCGLLYGLLFTLAFYFLKMPPRLTCMIGTAVWMTYLDWDQCLFSYSGILWDSLRLGLMIYFINKNSFILQKNKTKQNTK